MRIGVLAVQGAFIEHEHMMEKLGADVVEIRQKDDLAGIDGIILPGGESTVQSKLLKELDIFDLLREKILAGLPVLGTCAGLILLADAIEGEPSGHLRTLPVTVKRNAYGRQLGSFVTLAPLKGIGEFPMTFIRAPYISEVAAHAADGAQCDAWGTAPCDVSDTVSVSGGKAPTVEILAEVDGRIVAVQYGRQLGLAFHPELTGDTRIHEHFLSLCR